MEWRHSGSSRPKNIPSANIRWKSSRLDFFGIKTASSSFIIFQRSNYQRGVLLISCWCNWRTFWRKKAAGRSPRLSCSCTTMPRLTGALATQKKLAYLGYQCLDHPPCSPDLALFPGLKKQLKGRHFSPNVEVIVAAETWLDGQPSEFFLSGLQKLGGVCWINPEFGRCSLFPSWSG